MGRGPRVIAALAVLAVLVASLVYNYVTRTDEGARRLRVGVVRIPVVGPVIRRMALSRLLFSMAGLLSSGVRFDAAFRLLQTTTLDPELEASLGRILRRVVQGDTLSEAFQREEAFGNRVHQMVLVGETSGQLPELLYRTAESLELEVETALERMLALVEPALLIFLGCTSAVLVLAAFLPLVELLTTL